jgi:outer membrane receptor protein involved in Fe transport
MKNKASLVSLALKIALGLSIATALPPQLAIAASGDGSLVGQLKTSDASSLEGVEITVRNPETGFSRTVKPDAEGNYRFPFLPVGRYEVEASKNGSTIGKLAEVDVSLGTATTADVNLNITGIDSIEVTGTRIVTAVDVRSTESATNITRAELERLPVERDLLSVAMLAPGLTAGDSDLGDGTSFPSFGGSSIAENTVYINGLNVTDFYNRVGFSAVPYAFYKEFQVKTGGYSVEFGRTTGGVVNAVTRSGTNEFEFGTEIAWEPDFLQSSGTNRYDAEGNPRIISSYDEYDRTNATAYASGPIIQDKLFFFALYEARDFQRENTTDAANTFYETQADDAFWGAKLDWQISDNHLLEALAFSDKNEDVRDAYQFDFASGERVGYENTRFTNNGGENWALTYTGYLTDNFQMKALYGENEREFSRVSNNDIECNRVRDLRTSPSRDVGCTSTSSVTARLDNREAARLDFEWTLGDHLLRFGMDHETNTSQHDQFYPGPDRLLYEVNQVTSGTLPNGAAVPPGVTAYVRTRQNEVDGEFETINSAYYLEDNWQATSNLLLNAGVRVEAFDNRNSDGDTYIKMDDMIAPRFGFSWDMKGDGGTKLFGNAGRYFLPVANVINIKQAGGFLDRRTFYVFEGFEDFDYNGLTRQRPILGAQLGDVDTSQGDGTVGDLRGEVDADMDPVYQDELILGFQSMIDDKWSWGVRGIYRKLNNAIDDMEITSTGVICDGEPVEAGYVMANPGEDVTIFSDTNCDGDADGYVTIDTSQAGWALYDADGNYVGETGYAEPRRDYRALELIVDRAWDDRWTFNGSYTLSYARGNAEGPVNSDTNFADAGRTEAFDDPWVNYGSYGRLPNDRRHQFKFRGAYAITESWSVGATLSAASGRPISALGSGNPFDDTDYNSFFICTANCLAPHAERTYELAGRGNEGETPWVFDLGATVAYRQSFAVADLQVKFSVYNLLNQERVIEVDEELFATDGSGNANYKIGTGYHAPRYGLLTVTLDF